MLSKTPIVVCLINFMIAATMGLLLRYAMLGGISFNYRFLTHAHSHVAMLGWLYLAIYVLIVKLVVTENHKLFYRLFWLTQLSVLGMMISFPLQGYALFSITFSTLHIFCSYYFAYKIWKHLRKLPILSQVLLKSALIFMLISTVGVWLLGYIMKSQGSESIWYELAIQWFLHFQFNGWFVFAVLGLLFFKWKPKNFRVNTLVWVLALSVILTAALPFYWHTNVAVFYWLNAFGVLFQFIALLSLLMLAWKYLGLKTSSSNGKWLLYFGIGSLILKAVFQLTTISSEWVFAAFENRNLIIGFIHLLMLGALSSLLFVIILNHYQINITKITTLSRLLFILGIVITEILLLFQGLIIFSGGTTFQFYYWSLFCGSLLMVLGIALFTYNFIFTKNSIIN